MLNRLVDNMTCDLTQVESIYFNKSGLDSRKREEIYKVFIEMKNRPKAHQILCEAEGEWVTETHTEKCRSHWWMPFKDVEREKAVFKVSKTAEKIAEELIAKLFDYVNKALAKNGQ